MTSRVAGQGRRFFGWVEVGFLRTLGVGVGVEIFIRLRLRKSNWIVFLTSHYLRIRSNNCELDVIARACLIKRYNFFGNFYLKYKFCCSPRFPLIASCYENSSLQLKDPASKEESFLLRNISRCLVFTQLPAITNALSVIAQSALPRWFWVISLMDNCEMTCIWETNMSVCVTCNGGKLKNWKK